MLTPQFMGFTYCPVRELFREQMEETLATLPGSEQYHYVIPNGHQADNRWKLLHLERELAKMPELITSAGFNGFFSKGFRERFIESGAFHFNHTPEYNALFRQCGLVDPDNGYFVYAVMPLIFLVDHSKLNGRPVPQRWEDLLDPCFHGDIVIGGNGAQIHEDILLYFYQQFGDAGVRAFLNNLRIGMHGAQMAREAGTAQGAAVYLPSWIFGRCCPKRYPVELIWPEDGAMVTPLFAMARPDLSVIGQALLGAVSSAAYGMRSASNAMPVAHPSVDNRLPSGAKLRWLGWDYIKGQDLPALTAHLEQMAHLHFSYREVACA